jgi:hypothetical protein
MNLIVQSAHSAAPWYVALAPLFSLASTAIIGAFAAYIGWRQMKTARTKLQFDLYDKRYPIYDSCNRIISELCLNNNVTPESMSRFREETAGAEFIFDNDIGSYIDKIWWAISDNSDFEAENLPGFQDLAFWRARMDWMKRQRTVIDDIFAPYLQLEVRKARTRARKRWESPPTTADLEASR